MPQNKQGSILIYTLFLSSFLILFFVSFQGEIEKSLINTQGHEQTVQDISHTRDALVLLGTQPEAIKDIDSANNTVLASLTQNENILTGFLESRGSQEYWITDTGGVTTLPLDIIDGGPVLYRLATFDSGAESSATLVSSGVVTHSFSLPLSGGGNQYILLIEGLGGQTRYTIDMGVSTAIPQSSLYRKTYTVSGYSRSAGTYEIIHFAPKTRAGFPYEQLGMYLKR
ncbi:MAG: hypothetical protein PHH70_02785 [Candidatus Gracilibacteria bacterium]|nr:hypothetical protein [Candidatus Gracilibacteria bacterium]